MRIFHIALPDDWNRSTGGEYSAASLQSEGFIHCSFEHQLDDVLKRYYSDASEVVILEIDPSMLRSKLVVELSTGGESYPHIYGTINTDAIVKIERRQIT